MTPEGLEEVQQLLGDRYVAKRIIGRGGMARVVLAHQVALERDVAIKILFEGLKSNAGAFARFKREAKVCAQLSHPNIVAVHDVDDASGFIVMQYVAGETAKERLQRGGKLSSEELVRIGTDILEALRTAHAAGVVHRDIKPSNILLDESGLTKLADFGIAFVAETPLTQAGHVVGTPAYMAPEQLRGHNVDGRADIYGLGSTLFELATGEKLHKRDESVQDPAQAILSATGNAGLAQVISIALADSPDDRFADAAAMQSALQGCLEKDEVAVLPPPRPTKTLRPFLVAMVFALSTTLGVGALVGAVRSKKLSGPVRLAVLPFDAPVDRADLAFARTGLPELIDNELGNKPSIEILRPEILERELPRLNPQTDDWLLAARAFGASSVATGGIEAAADGRLTVTTKLLASDGEQLEAWTHNLTADELTDYLSDHASDLHAAAQKHAVDADLHYLRALGRGVEALGEHRLGEAIIEFKKANQLNPARSDAPYYLSIASWWAERPPAETRLAIEACLRTNPDKNRREFLQGLQLLIANKWHEAEGYFDELHRRQPRDRGAMYGLFEARFHGGDVARAMTDYRQMAESFPRFRLGARHALTYSTVQVDEELMAWAREHVAGDDLYLEWEARQYVALRDYPKALAHLTRAASSTDLAGQARSQLTQALLQTRMLAGHEAVVQAHLRRSDKRVFQIEHALALLHGDAELTKKMRSALIGLANERAEAGLRVGVDIIMRTTIAELPLGDPEELTGLNDALNAIFDERDEGNPRIDLLRAFVAIKLQARDLLQSLSVRRHQETQAVAKAGLQFLDKDYAAAALTFGAAVKAAGDGRFAGASSYFSALAASRAGQSEAALSACDEVIRPRLFEWSWGGYVGPCLLISAEASAQLNDDAGAKAYASRLLKLRSAAGDDDLLRQAALKLGGRPK